MDRSWLALPVICLILLSSCAKFVSPNPGHPPMTKIKATLNQAIDYNASLSATVPSVTKLLMPGMSIAGQTNRIIRNSLKIRADKHATIDQKHFNVAVNAVPAQEFFASLVRGTHDNIVVDPTVEGNITLKLKNVTLPEVLSAVEDANNVEIKKTSYGYLVVPPTLETRVFVVNYVNAQRKGSSSTSVSGDGESSSSSESGSSNGSQGQGSSSVSTETETNFWQHLDAALQAILGEGAEGGHRVVIDKDAGVISVKASHHQLNEIAKFLDIVQRRMTQQVIIDAKIIEVQLNKDFLSGVNWKILGFSANLDGPFPKVTQDGMESVGDFIRLGVHSGDFDKVLKMLSSQGNVQVLSSPRVSTLNNQKAVIKVGEDQFFLTGASSTNVTTANNPSSTQNFQFVPFFSGITLDVTPQIAQDKSVILHIHPLVSQVSEDPKKFVISGSNDSLNLPKKRVRESDNIVRAQNGQVIVIGGLMTDVTEQGINSVPFAGKVPLIGSLFRQTNQNSRRSELIILLKPVVVGGASYASILKQARHELDNLDEGYKLGAFPDRFGNLGEYRQKRESGK